MELIKKIKLIALIIIPIFIIIISITTIHHQLSIKDLNNQPKGSTYLKQLTIDGHDLDFHPEQETYEIALDNQETSLSINAKAEDKSATIKIFNNDDLTNHNAVYIYVTSKDHNIRKYTINYNNQTATNYFNKNIDNCSDVSSDYCIKFFNLKNDEHTNFIIFTYDYLESKGYPHTNIMSINDKQVFAKKLNNGEFHNFNIIDNNVIFTYYNQKEKNKQFLFGTDIDGNIILNYDIINNNYKNLYTYDINIMPSQISLKTRFPNQDKASICKLQDKDIIEARYTIKYENGHYSKPILNNTLTVQEYKIIMNIKCN